MPRLPRRQIGTSYGHQHVFQLLVGFDAFGDAFGDDIDAMRAAWPILRDRVFAEHARRQAIGRATRERPWGEQFDDSPA